MKFQDALLSNLVKNYYNCYIDNFDYWYYEAAYGKTFAIPLKTKIKGIRKKLLLILKKCFHTLSYKKATIQRKYPHLDKYNFEFLYNLLEREKDKQLLLQIISYKILGNEKVKLTDTGVHNKNIELAKIKTNFNDYITVSDHDDYKLYKIDFRPIKNFALYSTPLGYVGLINEKAYNLDDIVAVKKGDFVIDCGAYSCDTAIPFAETVGDSGKVFAFEFINDNLILCNKNLELNSHLKDRITIVQYPLSDRSGLELNFTNDSSCSNIVSGDSAEQTTTYLSKSIDDYVAENNIYKVDFIKMDIEGSELAALKGAENVIKTYHPKLAISIYHKLEDLDEIPKFIKKIAPDYKFYLGYTGCVDAEYVLFCK